MAKGFTWDSSRVPKLPTPRTVKLPRNTTASLRGRHEARPEEVPVLRVGVGAEGGGAGTVPEV